MSEPIVNRQGLNFDPMYVVAGALRRREISSVELVEAALAQVDLLGERLNPFITLTTEQALAEARQRDDELRTGTDRGPLHGIPIVLKDLFDTAGSSSGTAAAIASGMAWCGPGSDTGGSIRMPSAACGLVGLKPTYGRVSLRGVLPLAASLDHVGPMARTVRDAALLMRVLAWFDPADPHSRDAPVPEYAATLEDGVAGLRIAAFSDDGNEAVAPDILDGFRAGLRTLEAAGAHVEDVDLSFMRELADDGAQYFAEVYDHYGALLDQRADLLSPYVRDVLERGREVTGAEVMAERRARDANLHRVERALAGYDLAVSPTLALHPPPAGEICLPLIRFTSIWDKNGWPAITVPSGISPLNGLPIGFQIIARPWQEALVLRAARVVEVGLSSNLVISDGAMKRGDGGRTGGG